MTDSKPASSGVILRAGNGDVIGYDESGLVLRLADRVISDIAARPDLAPPPPPRGGGGAPPGRAPRRGGGGAPRGGGRLGAVPSQPAGGRLGPWLSSAYRWWGDFGGIARASAGHFGHRRCAGGSGLGRPVGFPLSHLRPRR